MLTLTIRTDKPEAEIGLYEIHDRPARLAYVTWEAHRRLAETIHAKIRDMLAGHGYELHDLQAIAAFAGPGSFTGLRIGLSVANALAYALSVPIVAQSAHSGNDDWLDAALRRLAAGESVPMALPEYGADPHITLPKK